MRIGFIGAGTVAQAIARRALGSGHEILLSNSRGADSLADVVDELGERASAGSPQEAAETDIVILAVPWAAVPAALAEVRKWDGLVLVDATNLFDSEGSVISVPGSSGSEFIAGLATGAHVVKAFNTLYARQIAAGPLREGGRLILFYAGDDRESGEVVGRFADGLGFWPVRIGGLRDGGPLMEVGDGPLSGLHALKVG
jgi:8-hydroxy-5-deazaflavin:NADPH oxidoreductase